MLEMSTSNIQYVQHLLTACQEWKAKKKITQTTKYPQGNLSQESKQSLVNFIKNTELLIKINIFMVP